MGNLTHTVSGDIASFRSAARVPIESLKCHFLPIQEGTGDPSPENVRPITGWQGIEIYQDDIYLPKEYQRVEYLEATGNQYIYTNIPIQSPFTIDADFMYTSGSGDQCLICAGYNQDNRNIRVGAFGLYNQNLQNYYAGYWFAGTIYPNLRYKMKAQLEEGLQITTNSGIEINRATKRHNSADIPIDKTQGNFSIFCMYRNQTPIYYCYVKLYSITLHGETGSMVGNFIPCRRKSDNKPGMYDTISQTFFTNQGTGEFICGPDVGKTISVTFPALGKNLLDKNEYSEIMDTLISFGGVHDDSQPDGSFALAAGTYTFSTNHTMTMINIVNNQKQNISTTINTTTNTFTITEQQPIRILILDNNSSAAEMSSYNYQLEAGDTVTEYEPFNNTVYGGYVDLAKGEIVATHYCEPLTTTIENLSNEYQTENVIFFRCPTTYPFALTKSNASGNIIDFMCDSLKTTTAIIWSGSNHDTYVNHITRRYSNNQRVCMNMYKSQFSITSEDTLTEMNTKIQTYLSQYPIYISYKMETPIIYQLSPNQLKTLLGQNYIWSNANSNTEVSYAIHDSTLIQAAKKQIIVNEPHIETVSGTMANFNTDMSAPLKECKIYFNPIQEGSGDPSPENIRSINGLQSIELNYTNKNLLGGEVLKNKIANLMPNISINSNDGIISYNNADAANHQGEILYDKFKPNTRYTFIVTYSKDVNRYIHLRFDYSDGTYSMMSRSADITVTDKTTEAFISTANKTVVSISRQADEYSTVNLYYNESGLFEGVLTTNQFEISNNQAIPINWANNIGTIYGGYIDLITGDIYKTYERINLKNYTWGYYTAYQYYITLPDRKKTSTNLLNNMFPISTTNSYPSTNKTLGYYSNGASYANIIFIRNEDVADKNEFNTWLQSINGDPYVIYELDTPQYVNTITPTQIKTLIGTNNIWSDANGPIEVQYWTH